MVSCCVNELIGPWNGVGPCVIDTIASKCFVLLVVLHLILDDGDGDDFKKELGYKIEREEGRRKILKKLSSPMVVSKLNNIK